MRRVVAKERTPPGTLNWMRMNVAAPSCEELTFFTVPMWNGTSWPLMGSSTASFPRSTYSCGLRECSLGTADTAE